MSRHLGLFSLSLSPVDNNDLRLVRLLLLLLLLIKVGTHTDNNIYVHTCTYTVFVLPHPESNAKYAPVCINMQHKETTQQKHTARHVHTASLSRCHMVLQSFIPVCMFLNERINYSEAPRAAADSATAACTFKLKGSGHKFVSSLSPVSHCIAPPPNLLQLVNFITAVLLQLVFGAFLASPSPRRPRANSADQSDGGRRSQYCPRFFS